jgi:4-aminobutyrate aminotransferase-like enzyme
MSMSLTLKKSSRYLSAKKEMLEAILEASLSLRGVRGAASPEAREAYSATLQEFMHHRGRELYFPYLASGLGSGPFVELVDGSVKYDMISGIGINFFGHSHPELMAEMIDAVSADTMQGNLQPGVEASELLKLLLSKVGPKSRLARGWFATCGTMANELALKIIRQKNGPQATKVLAFKDCFCGRSTAMQEITDNPAYRQGQPVYGEAYYVSFYDPKLGLEKSIERSLSEMREHFTRFPGKFAAFMFEIVQGEGGFNFAPREFYVALFEEAKKAGLAIWADEIQTFGRTGEYFAFQKFNIAEYIDVATVAKMLQASAVLFTEEFNPKAGLIAGTFSGSTNAHRTGRRTLELLEKEGLTGPEGKIEKLSRYFVSKLKNLSETSCRNQLGDFRAVGGMIAFQVLDGSMDNTKKVLMKLFDLGVVAFYCGHGPYLIRMLPPLGAMSEADIDGVCDLLSEALCQISSEVARAAVPAVAGEVGVKK